MGLASHDQAEHGVGVADDVFRAGQDRNIDPVVAPEDLIADLEAGFERLNRAADTAGDGG